LWYVSWCLWWSHDSWTLTADPTFFTNYGGHQSLPSVVCNKYWKMACFKAATVLYYTILYHTILYCTILYRIWYILGIVYFQM
jgi:hypothetical protein